MSRHAVLILVVWGCVGEARRSPDAPPAEPRVFFGNLHSHTDYSDGQGTPDEAYKHARDVAKLDFLLLSEHNHEEAGEIAGNNSLYTGAGGGPSDPGLIPAATRFTEDGTFVALYGQEFSTISEGNHINVFDVPQVISTGNGEFRHLITWIEKQEHLDTSGRPALLQLNHPWDDSSPDAKEYGRDDFGNLENWIAKLDARAELIEVINGPAKTAQTGVKPAHVKAGDFIAYLNLGFHLAPTANQDNHRKTWGDATEARTGVVATALTKAAIMDALRARHCYATTDRNLEIIARVNGHLMGDVIPTLPAAGDELDITLVLKDQGEAGNDYVVDVWSDDKPGGSPATKVNSYSFTGTTPAGQTYALDGVNYTGPGQYLFLTIKQIDETDGDDTDKAWTAPVWFETVAPEVGQQGRPRIVSLVPNTVTPETQTEKATIRNTGTGAVDMTGWRLRDPTDQTWSLTSLATLAPGEEKTITRLGQDMGMNNTGDTIVLVNPQGEEVQIVTYGSVAENEVVTVNE